MSQRPATAAELGLMRGSPPAPEQRVTLENFQQPPYSRWSFQHISELIPTARVRRVEPICEFARAEQGLSDLEFDSSEDRRMTIHEMLERTYTDGFLVLHRGRIVTESYFNGMQASTLHLLMSCSKSYLGTLFGSLVGAGQIDVDAPVESYLPELNESGFAGDTVRHLLDMASAVKFSEDYEASEGDVRWLEVAGNWAPVPDGYSGALNLRDYISGLTEQDSPRGELFSYRSVITNLLGWLAERVSGAKLSELLEEVYWGPLGCEWDAALTVDREGLALADGGLNAALRDWARFGQMIAQDGFFNGRQIIPASWIHDCRFGDDASRAAFRKAQDAELFPNGHYRNQWWGLDRDAGTLLALGIHGQMLYVDPRAGVVIAKYSTRPRAEDIGLFQLELLGVETIAQALG